MRPHLAAVASQQGGLFTTTQAREAGHSRADLRSGTAVHGPWLAVRRGVYVEREVWAALTEDERWGLRDRAASLSMVKPHVLSHDSAARLHGLPLLRARTTLRHITRPGVGGSRTEHGVRHHLGRAVPPHNVEVDGLRATALARTAIDVAREHGFRAGVVAADGAMRRGVTQADFVEHLGLMRHWPHVRRARAATAYADPRAESVLESLGRILVEDLGFGKPWPQFPVRVGDQVIWVDLLLGCHAFELDGRVKYTARERGGVVDDVEAAVWDEKRRERLLRGEGLAVSRVLWEDAWGAARERALARLRQEYLLTCRQLGAETPAHLVQFARRTPYAAQRLVRGQVY
jgi:hypothetical protein